MNKVKTKPLIYLVIASACLLILLTFIALYTHRNNRSNYNGLYGPGAVVPFFTVSSEYDYACNIKDCVKKDNTWVFNIDRVTKTIDENSLISVYKTEREVGDVLRSIGINIICILNQIVEAIDSIGTEHFISLRKYRVSHFTLRWTIQFTSIRIGNVSWFCVRDILGRLLN